MGLGTAAAAPLAGSVAIFSNFDDAMRGVAAITQATGSQLESLRNTAKKLGATTSYSASEVASLMTELGRAGFKPEQIEKMTAAVMNMARATGTDATQASGIMAATIRQFGMEAGEATRVADGLTAAANKSFNTVESLGEASVLRRSRCCRCEHESRRDARDPRHARQHGHPRFIGR